MAVRNLDLDSALRAICTCGADKFGDLLKACAGKMKQCKLGADPSQAVAKAPRHGGRRNPRRGQLKGSGDVNLRGLVDWVESIEPLPAAPEGGWPEEGPPADYAAMADAHQKLVKLHATLAAHQV